KSAGIPQNSPQTQRMAAPICCSAYAGRVSPGTWEYAEYHETWEQMLIDRASIHMTPFVAISAAACDSSGSLRRKGGDGMNCSQKSTPAMKKLACASQMCTAGL